MNFIYAQKIWSHRDHGSSRVVVQLGLTVTGILLLILFQGQLEPLKERLLQRQAQNISQEFVNETGSGEGVQHKHNFVYLSDQRHWCHCGAVERCADGSDPDDACDVCGQVMRTGREGREAAGL